MDSSDARLDIMEAQRSHDQHRRRYLALNQFKRLIRILPLPSPVQCIGERILRRKIESIEIEFMSDFLITNLRLSDLFDVLGESVPMNPETFSAVSAGNMECMEKLRSYDTPMACLKSDQGNSILHLAAAWGHLELVKSIVLECPSLLLESNWKYQLPLHVAAHAGHSAVVGALVAAITFFSARLAEESREGLNLYAVKDKDGDTALHLALKGRHMKMAACLVKANQRASFLANEDNISPLYLAAQFGNVSLLRAMFETPGNDGPEGRNSTLSSQLEGRKLLVHAALKAKNTDILELILKEDPSLGDERDEEGRTCLSFGASIGYYNGVCNLLDQSTQSVYVCDDDGSFPIHMAAKNGHMKVVKEILNRCPDSKQLINKQGQNILHIAAKSGKHRLVSYLVKSDKTEHLSIGQDLDGNTPLHIATINWDHKVVHLLAMDEKALYIRNKSGLSARDIAESKLKSSYNYEERFTLMLLLNAHAIVGWEESIKSVTRPSHQPAGDKNKDYMNTLLLVATLIATVTFAAGITIPGGFNNVGPHLGMATLATKPSLFIFLVLDTLAMQSSVVTIATLIWAQLGDSALFSTSSTFALLPLFFSLLCMPVAFVFGVVSTVGHVTWLLVVISSISCLFFGWVLIILGPHVFLQLPHVPPTLANYIMIELILHDIFDTLFDSFVQLVSTNPTFCIFFLLREHC